MRSIKYDKFYKGEKSNGKKDLHDRIYVFHAVFAEIQ